MGAINACILLWRRAVAAIAAMRDRVPWPNDCQTRLNRQHDSVDALRESVLDEYVSSIPSAQNAVDLIAGWNHALPPQAGAVAGSAVFYEDSRINWCIKQFGNLNGLRILELGPLEGAHTYMLHQQNPALIHAVEANKLSFLRCLVAKQLLELDKAHFMIGDFQKWLEFVPERYDLIVASGVLYHMTDPARLLELMADRSDALYIWTHYFSEEAMPLGDIRRGAFSGAVKVKRFKDFEVRLHARSYHGAWRNKAFCGGMHDEHYWMEKNQILEVLKHLGFDDVRPDHDSPDHPNGPSFSIFAQRTSQSRNN